MQSGYRALYSLPLADDQGRVGLLLYEAEDPDFLGEPHFEMIKILAGQTKVAIRNVLLYREVPLISLLEPLLARKRALMGTSRGRRIAYEAAAVVVLAFLALCQIPMRNGGEAVVAPRRLVTRAGAERVQAEFLNAEAERARSRVDAPVKAPRSLPNNSDSIRFSGSAAQFRRMNGFLARRLNATIARAASSFPVPLSPRINTFTLLSATC